MLHLEGVGSSVVQRDGKVLILVVRNGGGKSVNVDQFLLLVSNGALPQVPVVGALWLQRRDSCD